jgi:hypothetical protein
LRRPDKEKNETGGADEKSPKEKRQRPAEASL